MFRHLTKYYTDIVATKILDLRTLNLFQKICAKEVPGK